MFSGSINVINRRGESMNMDLATISNRLKNLAYMHPKLNISTDMIAVKTASALTDGIHTSKIDSISAGICASLISEDEEYDSLAARIIASDLHKTTSSSLLKYATELEFYDYRNRVISILDPKLIQFVKTNLSKLENTIDYQKDYKYNYFGLITMINSYLLSYKYDNNEKITKERPQQMLMRVSIGIYLNKINDDGTCSARTMEDIIETYKLLSDGYYTHATPTLFNAGTISHTLSSCYLLSINDSLENIYTRVVDVTKISKFSGGIGVHVSQVRASGSVIGSTIGRSEGLVPMMRVYNEAIRHVSQGGGKRKGSAAIYVEPWHADIEDVLMSQKQQGAPERLCRDLFLALWIPDLFMIRLKRALQSTDTSKPVVWSLMCPNECKGLPDTYGDDFTALYLDYEQKGLYRKQVNILELWNLIMATQIETGKPYLMYKDHVNRKCNQNNLGVIKSSNLCVHGDTPILTDTGYQVIKNLTDQKVKVWNGMEWSQSLVAKTNTNQELVRVTLTDGSYLDCTKYHKFIIRKNNQWVETPVSDLQIGDISKRAESFPIVLGDLFKNVIALTSKLDKEAGCAQVTSNNKDELYQLKLLANTVGCNPFLTYSCRGYHLRFNSTEYNMLNDNFSIGKTYTNVIYQPELKIESIIAIDGLHDTYCFNEPNRHMGIFNGMLTSQCAEITIYSDDENIGVCNLASIALPKFVKPTSEISDNSKSIELNGVAFDFQQLFEVTQKVVYNMNQVMDNNKYPLAQAKHSDDLNRPIGVGVQGLSEVFMRFKIAYDSDLAKKINKLIFETMHFACLTMSNKLAMINEPYKNFSTSMTAQGKLQPDLWGVTPSDMWNWKDLRSDIVNTGLYNSLLMALMPTAGTSIILGHTEGTELLQSNIFTRSTLSGRFQIINKYLVKDLKACGLWTKNIKNKIMENDGSIQLIQEIPDQIKEVYKTIYEVKLSSLIEMSADREAYVCQSSSNNRYLSTPSVSILTKMHLLSFKKGLKTSSYYVRVKQLTTGKKQLSTEPDCLSCSA